MKKLVMVLLCLLPGCEFPEQENAQGEICTMDLLIPSAKLTLLDLPADQRFQITFAGRFLLNTCDASFAGGIYSYKIHRGKDKDHVNLEISGYLNQPDPTVQVEVTPTDENCEPLIDQIQEFQFFKKENYNDSECGPYLTSISYELQPAPGWCATQ